MLYPQRTCIRDCFTLNGVWDYSREREEHDYSAGFVPEKCVAVPGSFNDQFVDEEFRMWMDGVWISRRFEMPRVLEDQRIVLRFGSVSYHAEVFLNGRRLGEHETGYTPFEFDITDAVRFDAENLLCIRVENTLSPDTVPMGNLRNGTESGQIGGQYPDTPFDFFPYAGIHRPVTIYSTSKIAWLDSIKVDTDIDGTVKISGRIAGSKDWKNNGGAGSACFQCLETSLEVPVVDGAFSAEFKIEDVKLWDVYAPNLYDVKVRLLDNGGEVLDDYTQRFGVRSVQVEGNRLLLNGKPVYLKGFGRHEDFPILGKALNECVNVRDHEMLKWINANSYRTTHYPYSEELVRLADEQGILLISEAPAVSVNLDYMTEQSKKMHLQVMEELVRRDYNNPSVIMWSVANEATSDREEARQYFKDLASLVRSLDSSRPVTMVSCKLDEDRVAEYFDVVSVNLYPGWYHLPGQVDAAKEDMRSQLQRLYDKFKKPVFITEFGADAVAGFHSLPAEQWSEEYQTDLLLGLIEVMREFDFVIGEHVWNFADFRTAQNHSRVGGNKKGVFTRDRQPKMAAHFLRKKWAEDTV